MTELARRVMKARRKSICPACGHVINVGTPIAQLSYGWIHRSHILEQLAASDATAAATPTRKAAS